MGTFTRLVLLLLLVPLAACGGDGPASEGGDAVSPGPEDVSAAAPTTDDVVGVWVAEKGPEGTQVDLREDGTLVGNDGCNDFGGQGWTLSGADVAVSGDRISTLRACEGVDTWLDGATSFRWDAGTLQALNPAGDVVGTLVRAD